MPHDATVAGLLSDAKDCFVAMPIRSPGSDEHGHFEGVYHMLRSTLEGLGYRVSRSDKSHSPGNINKEIVARLAEAPLVVADLTDLNPNVFYELGVRHALRRAGTILLIDKKRSPSIPFDLSAYRVIQYEGSVSGIASLMDQLKEAVVAVASKGEEVGDSPVHDWYPELPSNLIEHGRKSVEPELAAEIVRLRTQVETLRERLASSVDSPSTSPSGPHSSVARKISALRQARTNGEISLVAAQKAEAAISGGDFELFLDATEEFLRAKDDPVRVMFLRFHGWARAFGQDSLGLLILEEGLRRFADDPKYVRDVHLRMAQSRQSDVRARAKDWFAGQIGVDLETGEFRKGADLSGKHAILVGHLLEILHAEEQDELGLRILEAMKGRATSNATRISRDYARQLDWLDRNSEALEAYKVAIANSGDQESLRWFGNFLHNNGLHVEAMELFALETYYDLDDPSGPLNFANDLSFHLFDYFALKREGIVREPSQLPESIGEEEIARGVAFALCSVDTLGFEEKERLGNLTRRMGDDFDHRVSELAEDGKAARIAWIKRVYSALASDLTQGTPVGSRLLADQRVDGLLGMQEQPPSH